LKTLYWILLIGGGLLVALFLRGTGITIQELITGKRQPAPAMQLNPSTGGLERYKQVAGICPPMPGSIWETVCHEHAYA
jgi:hypothetical protein